MGDQPEITPDGVQAAVGDGFSVRQHAAGNVQVQLEGLGQIRPYDVCKKLVSAADGIVAAGFATDPNEIVRLSWNTHDLDKDGNEIWKPYPQLWVNQPTQQAVQQKETQTAVEQNSAAIQQLSTGMNDIKAMFAQFLGQQQQATSVPVKTEAPKVPVNQAPPENVDPF